MVSRSGQAGIAKGGGQRSPAPGEGGRIHGVRNVRLVGGRGVACWLAGFVMKGGAYGLIGDLTTRRCAMPTDADRTWQRPGLGVSLLLRAMLHSRWDAETGRR